MHRDGSNYSLTSDIILIDSAVAAERDEQRAGPCARYFGTFPAVLFPFPFFFFSFLGCFVVVAVACLLQLPLLLRFQRRRRFKRFWQFDLTAWWHQLGSIFIRSSSCSTGRWAYDARRLLVAARNDDGVPL